MFIVVVPAVWVTGLDLVEHRKGSRGLAQLSHCKSFAPSQGLPVRAGCGDFGGCSQAKPACSVPGFGQKHLGALHEAHAGLAVLGARYWCALAGLGLQRCSLPRLDGVSHGDGAVGKEAGIVPAVSSRHPKTKWLLQWVTPGGVKGGGAVAGVSWFLVTPCYSSAFPPAGYLCWALDFSPCAS